MPERAESEGQKQFQHSLWYGVVLGQVGCLTLAIVIGALVGGLALDRILQTKPLFTILLMVGSVPVTIYLMFRVVFNATARLRTPKTSLKEGRNGDLDS